MALTKFTGETGIISGLANKPVENATELKGKFDAIGIALKDYINNTLTRELDTKMSELSTKINSVYPVGAIYMSVNSTNPSTLFGGTWVEWGQGKVPVGFNINETEFNESEKTGGEKTHTLSINEIPSHGHSVSIPSSGSCTISSSGGHSHTITSYYKSDVTRNGGSQRMGTSTDNTGSRTNGATIAANTGTHTHTVPNHTHTVNQSNAGGGQAHNILQPYITCYMWKRTA